MAQSGLRTLIRINFPSLEEEETAKELHKLMKPLPGNTISVARLERHLAGELPLPAPLGIHLGMLMGEYPKPLLGMMGIGPNWQSGARAILTDISNVKGELTESPVAWLAKIMESEGVPSNRNKIAGLFSGDNPPRPETCRVLAKHLPTFKGYLHQRQFRKDTRASRGKAAFDGSMQLTDTPQAKDLAPICGPIRGKRFIMNLADALQGAPGEPATPTSLASAMRNPEKMRWTLVVQISWLLGSTPDWAIPEKVAGRHRRLAMRLIKTLLDTEGLPYGTGLYEWLKPRLQEQGIKASDHALGKWFKGLLRPNTSSLNAILRALDADQETRSAIINMRGLQRADPPPKPRKRSALTNLRKPEEFSGILESILIPQADPGISKRIKRAAAERLQLEGPGRAALAKTLRDKLASEAKLNVPLELVKKWMDGTSGISELEVDAIAASLSISTPALIAGARKYINKVPRGNDIKVIAQKLNAYTNTSLQLYPLLIARSCKPAFEDRLKMLLYVRGVIQSPTASRGEVADALKYLMGFQYRLDRNSSDPIDPSEIRDLVLLESRCGSERGWLEDGILTRQSIVQFNLDRLGQI